MTERVVIATILLVLIALAGTAMIWALRRQSPKGRRKRERRAYRVEERRLAKERNEGTHRS